MLRVLSVSGRALTARGVAPSRWRLQQQQLTRLSTFAASDGHVGVLGRIGQLVLGRMGAGDDSSSSSFTGKATSWSQAVSEAETLVVPKGQRIVDPLELVGKDIRSLTDNIKKLITTDHPVLSSVAKYYFNQNGKHIRPLIILLVSQAASFTPPETSNAATAAPAASSDGFTFIDTPVSPVLAADTLVSKFDPQAHSPSISRDGLRILPTQRRLAEITEMIHTASLLHDDVIDNSYTRRNVPTVNAEFGNKIAILAGDYLLARASVSLARLRNCEVVELLATVIENLVEGEVMQLKNKSDIAKISTFDYYMEKTYMKTASLIAKSCRAATVLGGCDARVSQIAYDYGKNIGLAFQLVDDMLDFTGSADEFGKPTGADLKLGLATAPVLYAAEEHPELRSMIERRFAEPGDAERAFELVHQSNGLEKTRTLASSHCQKAINALSGLPESPAREALTQLTHKVLTRTK
ncbi:coq1 putative hexaprenyl diphosphate synthase [Sorochytrium milnesiophthora]